MRSRRVLELVPVLAFHLLGALTWYASLGFSSDVGTDHQFNEAVLIGAVTWLVPLILIVFAVVVEGKPAKVTLWIPVAWWLPSPPGDLRRLLTAGARGASKAHCPLLGEAVRLGFCRLLSAFVVGPELERAQVVRYRAVIQVDNARSVCPRLAAPRTGFSGLGVRVEVPL
jgi:hypothetical protein